MSLENTQRVLGYAAHHDKFRNAMRKSPQGALASFASDLSLSSDGCTDDEMAAVMSFSDADYQSFDKLIGTFEGSMPEGERTSLKIT
ncbi:MAG: hypothetical protein HRT35_26275 [Algicola sp.]|nr:hypothetical protein [Algicola sp.]